jgi:hypothetical protein
MSYLFQTKKKIKEQKEQKREENMINYSTCIKKVKLQKKAK